MTQRYRLGKPDLFIWAGVYAFGGLFISAVMPDVVSGLIWFAGSSLVLYVIAIRPLVEFRQAGLYVRNPVGSFLLPWAEIRSAEPNYFGLLLKSDGQRTRCAAAVQEWNASVALGMPTRARVIAEQVVARATAARHAGDESDEIPRSGI